MFVFVKYLWKGYKLNNKLKKVQDRMDCMAEATRRGDIRDISSNPKREWAMLWYDRYLIKKELKNR